MTGTQLKTFFEGLIDGDSIDVDLFLNLINNAKDNLEMEREWEYLKKVDETATSSTTAKSLPTDFSLPLKLYVGNDTTPYYQIPFEQKHIFTGNSRSFYIDMLNDNYYLINPPSGDTIYFYYLYQTDDITADTSPVFPAKFHKLLAFDAAKLFYAVDQSERSFNWSPEWRFEHERLRASMIKWDNNLKKRTIENGFKENDLASGLQYDSHGFDLSNY